MHALFRSSIIVSLALAGCQGARQAAVTGAPPAPSHVDTFRVAIPQLGNRQRTIRVYVPPGYANGRGSFPVLYFQDAQSLFTPGMFGDWLVDETVDRLVAGGRFAGVIIVAIDNSEHRWNEYGPWTNRRMFDWVDSTWSRATEGGEGTAYLAFITNTLKPEIDRRYRTLHDREHTGIGGSSMGGIISLHAGLTRPDVFSKVMAMSPAVWFGESGGAWLQSNEMLGFVRRHTLPKNVRFYVDIGTNERSRNTDPTVVDALRSGGVPDSRLRFVVDTGAVHNEAPWAKRFEGAVRWLYR